jgi:hypothetical protein
MEEKDLWLLLLTNFPLVGAVLLSLYRGWLWLGPSVKQIFKKLEDEIIFREQLRQEALADIQILRAQDKEKTEALKELSNVVKQSVELNEKLLQDILRSGLKDGR